MNCHKCGGPNARCVDRHGEARCIYCGVGLDPDDWYAVTVTDARLLPDDPRYDNREATG